MKPTIVTLTGPTCSGKSTLERALAARGFSAAVSTTTRNPRDGEIDGIDYHFVDRSRFEQMQRDDALIESVEFNGNYYGLSSDEVVKSAAVKKPLTVVCEPHGAFNIRNYAKARGWSFISVFVDVPILTSMKRYLERFRKEMELGANDRMIDAYAIRMTGIIEHELKWSERKDEYDLYVSQYCMKTQYSVIAKITSMLTNCVTKDVN